MVFYDPQHSLSLIHYCSNYLRAFSPVSSLDHLEYMPGPGFIHSWYGHQRLEAAFLKNKIP